MGGRFVIRFRNFREPNDRVMLEQNYTAATPEKVFQHVMEFAPQGDPTISSFAVHVIVAAYEECRRATGILFSERFLILAAPHLIPGALIGIKQQTRPIGIL